MKQLEVADIFEEIACLLELKGENPFRIRAYQRAAMNLRNLPEDLEQRVEAGTLEEIPGIGRDLAQKIEEIVTTGRLAFLEKIRRQLPGSLVQLMKVPGVGPKTARQVYDRFKVKSLAELERIVRSGQLRKLPGFKERKEENLLRGIRLVQAGQERMPLGIALGLGEEVVAALQRLKEVRRISLAGSLRRRQETIGDIDVLITSTHPEKVMAAFVELPVVERVQAHGQTKASVRTKQGIQVDLRVVEPESFGAALVYFTGSKAHNIKIRSLAQRQGLTINEYGVFSKGGKRRLAGQEEEQVYRALGLSWVAPELREDLGEVEASQAGRLPRLIERADLRGSFHNHSDWTDGSHPIEEVALSARRQGYRYMLLSDHSRSLRVAGGLQVKELLQQKRQVAQLNSRLAPFRILMGSEVDILPDGRMDFPDEVLRELDVVIAAVHSGFKQPARVMTARIVKALQNRYVNILAHPTGRLIGERDPYEVDLDAVFRAAAQTGAALELNCYTRRLDLNDQQARRAKELGATLVLSTDTHVLQQLEDISLGLSMARRAWLGPADLLNTLPVRKLLDWVDRKRKGK